MEPPRVAERGVAVEAADEEESGVVDAGERVKRSRRRRTGIRVRLDAHLSPPSRRAVDAVRVVVVHLLFNEPSVVAVAAEDDDAVTRGDDGVAGAGEGDAAELEAGPRSARGVAERGEVWAWAGMEGSDVEGSTPRSAQRSPHRVPFGAWPPKTRRRRSTAAMAWPLRGPGATGTTSRRQTPVVVSRTLVSLSHRAPSKPPKRRMRGVLGTREAVPKSRGATGALEGKRRERSVQDHVSVSSAQASPCCVRPVRPQKTYSSLSTATAQWKARGPGPPTAAARGRNQRSSVTSNTTVSPQKCLP